MRITRLLPSAAIALLVGCASPQKPLMSEQQYAELARRGATADLCGQLGRMDLETASLGRTYVLSDMQQYTFDRTRLLAMMRAAARDYSTAECNQAAMAILERKRQIAQQNAQVARDEKELSDVLNKPKTNAACYRAGVQVLCTTY